MDAEQFDYVIVGAGAAGCVLAYRLSEDPQVRVALLEAGGAARHPLFYMPKGVQKIMQRPGNLWAYSVDPRSGTGDKEEYWVRGRVLGGSTAVNGLMWVRGQPADFEAIAEQSSEDWSWAHIGAAYAAIEAHELGAGDSRGAGGPLRISLPEADVRGKWHEAILRAGQAEGLVVKEDVNAPDDLESVGLNPRTAYRGIRQSAATAFLAPARKRPNLVIITGATANRVLFDGRRATGVEFTQRGRTKTCRATRDIILAGGAMASPGILERSGIGDPARLAALGIPVIHSNTSVGEHLIEHRALLLQWRLKSDAYSTNAAHHGLRLVWSALYYLFTRKGPLSSAAFDIGAWLKSRPGLNRPDTQFLFAPHSLDFAEMGKMVESFPGMAAVVYQLRPSSEGSVHIRSTDPEALPVVIANHGGTEEDRAAMVAGVRALRRFVAQEPLRSLIAEETRPGPEYESDEMILKAYDVFGTCGYHAVGSCRMGSRNDSVVDPELRVRGVDGLRVIDTSVVPVIPAGNTQAPVMAMAWCAADIILRDTPSAQYNREHSHVRS